MSLKDTPLLEKVLDTIKEFNLIDNGDRIVVGFSSGADSVFLALALLEIKDQYNLTLAIVHLNHGLRGEEAQKDEDFARRWAEEKSLPFFSKKTDIGKLKEKLKISEEEAGRIARYKFFQEVARSWKAGKIATAHTRTDSVETIFINLLRGAGVKGLAGIPPKRGPVIRPLIRIGRSEIRNYLRNEGIEYRIDRTNLIDRASRNYVRNRLFPIMEERFPGFEDRVLRLSVIMRGYNHFVEEIVEENIKVLKKKSFPSDLLLNREGFLKLHPFLKKAILHHLITTSYSATLNILNVIHKGGKTTIGKFLIEASEGDIRITEGSLGRFKETKVEEGELSFPRLNMSLFCKRVKRKTKEDKFIMCIPYDVSSPLYLRSRKSGDRVRIRGLGTKKLKDVFIDRKIPTWRRDYIPIITKGGNILWVVGILKVYPEGKGESYIKLEVRKLDEGKFWVFDN